MDQREIDKAHGAVGYAARVVAGLEDTIVRLDEKVARLTAQTADAQAARDNAVAELAEAQAELAVRSADPALTLPSSQGGGITSPTADPATGTGGN